MPPKYRKIDAVARSLQSGSIGGLVAIPFIVEAANYRENPPLEVAGMTLLVTGLLSSLVLSKTSPSERGLWGSVVTFVLYVLTLSQPVIPG